MKYCKQECAENNKKICCFDCESFKCCSARCDQSFGECGLGFTDEDIKQFDNVQKPSHYNQGKFETIEIIEDITKEGFESYLVGNILKYISRYKHKNGLEDLKKCRWYLDRLISKMEGE